MLCLWLTCAPPNNQSTSEQAVQPWVRATIVFGKETAVRAQIGLAVAETALPPIAGPKRGTERMDAFRVVYHEFTKRYEKRAEKDPCCERDPLPVT